MCKMTLAVFCAVGLALGLAGAAQAELISVDAAAATESSATYYGVADATQACNNSGMSDEASPTTTNFSIDSSPTHVMTQESSKTGWLTENAETVSPWAIFVFSSQEPVVAEFAVWNSNWGGYPSRGVQDLYIYTSPDKTGDTWTQQGGTWTFAQAPASGNTTGESFVLSSSWTNVRRVKFDVESSYGGCNFVGVNEVRFYTPEPATLALLGLGGLGMLLSRKRK